VQHTYFNLNGFQHKKDLPSLAVLAKNTLEEKKSQSTSQAIKRKYEKDKSKK
jgi:hypothetical protein